MPGADPYASYLHRAEALFAAGDTIQAGQIWQAILKREPSHAAAREGLLRVKERLEALAALPPPPSPVAVAPTSEDPEILRLLEQGCTLYDSGHVEDALRKWEKILVKNPGHGMARGYINGARKRLGQPPLPFTPAPASPLPVASEVRATIVQALPTHRAPESQSIVPPPELNPRDTTEGLLPQTPESRAVLEPLVPAAPAPRSDPKATLASGTTQDPKATLASQGHDSDSARPQDSWEAVADPKSTLASRDASASPTSRDASASPTSWESEPAPDSTPLLQEPETDRWLREGCTLFDMGQTHDALKVWERILSADPRHALAREYVNSARRDLGLPAPEGNPAPLRPDPETRTLETLLREAAQLYDMGLVGEATDRWNQVLSIHPGHPEAEAYLAMATPVSMPEPEPEPELVTETLENELVLPVKSAPTVSPDVLNLKLHQAERLLQLQHFEEAIFAFQRILQMDPGNPHALQGYQQARILRETTEKAVAAEPPIVREPPSPEPPARPPAALTNQATTRQGLPVPGPLAGLAAHPALKSPAILIGIAAGGLVLIASFFYWQTVRRDEALKATMVEERKSAMTSREAATVDLSETAEAIKQEASAALADDPLRAYYRAQEASRLNSADPGSVSLTDRARAALATAPHNPGLMKDYQRFVQAGDLDSAEKALLALQQTSPDDFDLKNRQGRLCLAMAQMLAARDRFDEARNRLRLGRAMFPQDKSWQARLSLLDKLQAMPKSDRVRWIPLLG